MRAKEYIIEHQKELKYQDIVSKVINDLLPNRMDKNSTDEYINRYLTSDIRYKDYQLRKELYERGNAMQQQLPSFEEFQDEVPMEIAYNVREEVFHCVEKDASFGYLFYRLGTEQNCRHQSEPIDCIPNEDRIKQSIIAYRDDYPKDSLDDYINEDINYQQYSKLIDCHYRDNEDELYLDYFNQVYYIFDEIRLRRKSISNVKSFLNGLHFNDVTDCILTLGYINTLIDNYKEADDSLLRCKNEISRILSPISSTSVEDSNTCLEKSPIFLNKKRGNKIDIIRVFNTLYELGFFTSEDGGKISKKDFMKAMGQAINTDLTHYDDDLSRALSDSTALEKHLRVFTDMTQKMKDIFDHH